ncbi:MAG: response regulator transcription factor [Burkholderiales bacterium]
MTRIFLVEDHAVLRERVRDAINRVPSVQVVGEADAVQPALEGIRASQPHAIVVDYHLGNESGLTIVKAIARELPSTRIIVFSSFMTERHKAVFERAGAHWCFDKSDGLDAMLGTIAGIAGGSDA